MDHLCDLCLVFVMFRVRLFIDALWSPAGTVLTSSLSFVMSNYEVVTFPFVSWIRCDAWLSNHVTWRLNNTILESCIKICKTLCFSVF